MEEENEFSDTYEDDDEEQEEALDPNNPEHEFAIVERDYNKTITEMEQNMEAAQFAENFNNLFEKFYQTYTKQKQIEQLNEENEKAIQEKIAKLELAFKLAEEDKKTIDTLKMEIENAWKLADAAHAREQLAQEIIDNLRGQVEQLNAEIEFKNKLAQETDVDESGDLTKHKDSLERERNKLINQVQQLTMKLNNAIIYQEELEQKRSAADLRINEITTQSENQAAEILQDKKLKVKLQSEISDLTFKLEDRDTTIKELNDVIQQHIKQVLNLETLLKERNTFIDKISKENDNNVVKLTKLQEDYNNSIMECDKQKKNNRKKIQELKTRDEQIHQLKVDAAKLNKTRDVLEKRIILANQEKDELQAEKINMRQQINRLEHEIDDYKKYTDEDKRAIEVAVKEKDVLNKTIQRQQAVAKDQLRLVQIQEQSKKKLEVELDTYFIESGKQKKQIHQLEKERDRLAEDQLELTRTIEDYVEDIREKKTYIFDLKKTITEMEIKIRQQQNTYETIRTDRNALEKLLQESTAEGSELKKKLKIVFHQTEQLKEDIAAKEALLVKDENIMRKIMKEKENLKIEIMSGLNQIRSLREELNQQKEEDERLHKTILHHEKTIRDQAKNITLLINEKDILGSQLVRRNDEIALLYEKIKLLQTTLCEGETQYDQRLEDIKLLKLEVKRLRQEKLLVSKSLNSSIDLKQEIFRLERDLTKSRLKCKALEQEMQNPMNIHRWRKLEGSDPKAFELLQKIKILQKRLLLQTSQAIERERRLKEAERLYLNLRQVLSKQPGPGIQEQLTKTQRALKLRGNKLKCLVTELNMAELKSAELKSELQRVTEELTELKKKYLNEKKTINQPKDLMTFTTTEKETATNRKITKSRSGADTGRFYGGGFRMSLSQV